MDEEQKTSQTPLETLEGPGGGPGSAITPGEPTEEKAPDQESPDPTGDSKSTKKTPLRRRLKEFSNLYFIVFLLVLLIIIGAVATFLTWDRKQNAPQKAADLTSEQLAQLQGNTTIVGDSSQILYIQSNTVLEGQLLVRKDLEVAGSIKVGGGLALSSVTVGGQGNFGQLQINGVLSVSGDTTFSGQLSVQENLNVAGSGSFGGNLTANQLTISTLKLNGDLQVNRHITVGGSLPSKSNGSALGSGGTVSVNGSDTAGTVTINTGSGPPSGCFVTISFANKFGSTPHIIISPSNSNAAGLNFYTNRSGSGFSVCTTSNPTASKTYLFDYFVVD